MKTETKVTSKGTTTIPEELRKQAGITAGTVSPVEFFDPENIGRVMASAAAGESSHRAAS